MLFSHTTFLAAQLWDWVTSPNSFAKYLITKCHEREIACSVNTRKD